MAQELILLNGIEIVQPDEMVGMEFETTFTQDSTRTQVGVAWFSPMFTVESYALKWSSLTLAEAQTILQIVAKGNKFQMHYPSAVYGTWRTDLFQVGKGSTSWTCVTTGGELIENLAFNVMGVNPI